MADSHLVLVVLLSTCVAFVASSDCSSEMDLGTACGAVKFYYNANSGNCYSAYMYDKGGNGNQFETKELCEQTCKGANAAEACELPYERGTPCNDVRWFYFKQANSCRRFGYNGAGGNGNNYETKDECEAACKTSGDAATNTGGDTSKGADKPPSGKDCTSKMDSGRACGALKYYYSAKSQTCVSAYVYKNGGNSNQFDSKDDCDKACMAKKPSKACEQSFVRGTPCDTSRWFYEKDAKVCIRFGYNGVGGNGNNYESKEECEAACAK